jgi:hypothetical protein
MDGFLHADDIRRKCVFFLRNIGDLILVHINLVQPFSSARGCLWNGNNYVKCFATAMIIGYEKMHLFYYINYELCRLLNVVTQLISFLNMYIILYSLK